MSKKVFQILGGILMPMLVWAESLRVLLELLVDGSLRPDELDPLGRHRRRPPGGARVQVAVVAEDVEVQRALHERGVAAERLGDLGEVDLLRAADVASVYQEVGRLDWLLDVNREVATRMADRAAAHRYAERSAGHNWTFWRDGTAAALEHLLPPRAVS